MQNCIAILQSPKKSMDGFFCSFLPTNKKPMDGRLSSMQNCLAILPGNLRGIVGAAAGGCVSNGAGRAPRNPGKPVKNGLLAIFYGLVFWQKPAGLSPNI